ncbi:carboxyl-terminal processing protease [Eubacterium sp. CAG:252]|nr:carboxyl-terminal processing protease [Eubacterium sp. CAG:252]
MNNQDGSNQTGRGQYDQQIADIVDEHNKERKYGSRFYRKGLLTGIIATFSAMVLIVLSVADVCLKKGYLHIGINGDVYIQSDAVTDESGIGSEVEAKLNAIDSVLDSFYFEEVDDEKAKDSIYKAYLSSYGDKYTVYYTADEYKKLTETTNGTFSGIGAVCQISSEGGILLVDVYESGAGYKAGLRSGDRIIQVDGTDVTDMDLSSAVALVKGEKGTQVGLKIVRDGATSDYTVVRDEIEVQTVNYAITEDNIGYISVSQFENVTAKQFKAAIEDLKSEGAKGIIIDIRNNPGGLLTTVISMLKDILPNGLIVYTEDKDGNRKEYSDNDNEELDMPLAVLVNGNSASASEIFAGAIQDYGKGVIVGTQTFGKGIVQTVKPLTDGSAIKFTIAKYFTPKGQDIHGKGVTPDVVVEYDKDADEDTQISAALESVRAQINQ